MKKLLLLLIFSMTMLPWVMGQNRTDARGLRIGKWVGTYSNGAVRYRGQFRNGKPYGTFRYFYPAGILKAKMTYSDDGRTAHLKSFQLNGKTMAEGKFINRKKDSTWLYFSDVDGKLVLEENYKTGVKQGPVIVFYPSTGRPSELTDYKNGRKNGRWIKYFPDGKISTSGVYVNDTLQGPFSVYDINGKLLMQGQYEKSLQEGLWITYDSLGNIRKKQYFQGGLPVKKKKIETTSHE
jgi:antitoxin component YwqK of YwqJK toxin-antitoxin module